MQKKDIINEFVGTIFEITRRMKGKMSFSCESVHLSPLKVRALSYINDNNTVTMTDIARFFNFELPSATSLLNGLYDMHLVDRCESKHDRRLVQISLTLEGKKWLKQAELHQRQMTEKMLSYLSEGEKKKLLSILVTLKERLKT